MKTSNKSFAESWSMVRVSLLIILAIIIVAYGSLNYMLSCYCHFRSIALFSDLSWRFVRGNRSEDIRRMNQTAVQRAVAVKRNQRGGSTSIFSHLRKVFGWKQA